MSDDGALYALGTNTVVTAGIQSKIETPLNLNYSFVPLPDITAWELAQIIPYLHGKAMYESDLVALGTGARHLVRK